MVIRGIILPSFFKFVPLPSQPKGQTLAQTHNPLLLLKQTKPNIPGHCLFKIIILYNHLSDRPHQAGTAVSFLIVPHLQT